MYSHQVREGTSQIRELIESVKELKSEVKDLRSTLAASGRVEGCEVCLLRYFDSHTFLKRLLLQGLFFIRNTSQKGYKGLSKLSSDS